MYAPKRVSNPTVEEEAHATVRSRAIILRLIARKARGREAGAASRSVSMERIPMAEDQEIELKFACGPDDLAAVLAAAPPGDDDHAELISVYFDTPDLDLKRAGASLRVREAKGQRVQTLKRGEGVAREEHEAPIEGLAPDPKLGPLPNLVPEGATLAPAFNVRVMRRQRRLSYEGAEIELALDQGEVVGGRGRAPICEVELELKSGEPAALFALARQLSQAAPLYLSFDSKAARGQALAAGEAGEAQYSREVPLTGSETVAEAFAATARVSLAQMAANAALLRARPTPETVHQLRVGARRVRSAVATFRTALADPELGRLKEELRWLSQACDRLRNLDVYAEALASAKVEVATSGLASLHKAVQTARSRARHDVARMAGSDRFRALMLDVTAWVETGEWRQGEVARSPIGAFAHDALDHRRRMVLKLGRHMDEADDERLHELRIAAKKLRYAGDSFAGLYGKRRFAAFVEPLKVLQTELGELNDIATAGPLVASLSLDAGSALAAGEQLGARRAERKARVRRAARALRKLADAKPYWR
jgi:inorganic triphosphatase YgiF